MVANQIRMQGRVPTEHFLDELKREYIDGEWLNGTLWVNPKCWKSTVCMVLREYDEVLLLGAP